MRVHDVYFLPLDAGRGQILSSVSTSRSGANLLVAADSRVPGSRTERCSATCQPRSSPCLPGLIECGLQRSPNIRSKRLRHIGAEQRAEHRLVRAIRLDVELSTGYPLRPVHLVTTCSDAVHDERGTELSHARNGRRRGNAMSRGLMTASMACLAVCAVVSCSGPGSAGHPRRPARSLSGRAEAIRRTMHCASQSPTSDWRNRTGSAPGVRLDPVVAVICEYASSGQPVRGSLAGRVTLGMLEGRPTRCGHST